jgi:aminopeptidase N
MLLYRQRFQYGNASTEEFEQAMEDASGQNLDWFFDEWVIDKGLPTYNWARRLLRHSRAADGARNEARGRSGESQARVSFA